MVYGWPSDLLTCLNNSITYLNNFITCWIIHRWCTTIWRVLSAEWLLWWQNLFIKMYGTQKFMVIFDNFEKHMCIQISQHFLAFLCTTWSVVCEWGASHSMSEFALLKGCNSHISKLSADLLLDLSMHIWSPLNRICECALHLVFWCVHAQ